MRDAQDFEEASKNHEADLAQWRRMQSLAQRVLSSDVDAYHEALKEFSLIGEIATLGSAVALKAHGPKRIECALQVNGREVIPAEIKSLTAAGKLSVKAMPKTRFHEIYQDYVCGCVLRLAREVFALLPVNTVLITASVESIDSSTGRHTQVPVLSLAIDRSDTERLDFRNLDPSDSLENFVHRGDVKASRKSGEFVAIVPLSFADLSQAAAGEMEIASFISSINEVRKTIAADLRVAPSKNVEPEEAADLSV
jgi:hypothetical protein